MTICTRFPFSWWSCIFLADNQLDHGPLHEAVAHWDLTVVEFLVQHGATVNAVDKEGRTPLHIAAYVNHVDVVIFLLDNGGG